MADRHFPDFSAKDFDDMSPRNRLMLIREFVSSHEGPITQIDVRRLLAQMCKISIEMIGETRSTARWSKDQMEAMRLLRDEIVKYERR